KPLRREGRLLAEPVVLPRAFVARGPWVSADTRSSLRPLFEEGGVLQSSDAKCAAGRKVHVVIARSQATKQSRIVRSILDCFAALAMTAGRVMPSGGKNLRQPHVEQTSTVGLQQFL